MVEQGTHKPLVGGSNPPSATSSLDAAADSALGIETFTSAFVAIRARRASVGVDDGRTSVRGLVRDPTLYSPHADDARSSSLHPEAFS